MEVESESRVKTFLVPFLGFVLFFVTCMVLIAVESFARPCEPFDASTDNARQLHTNASALALAAFIGSMSQFGLLQLPEKTTFTVICIVVITLTVVAKSAVVGVSLGHMAQKCEKKRKEPRKMVQKYYWSTLVVSCFVDLVILIAIFWGFIGLRNRMNRGSLST